MFGQLSERLGGVFNRLTGFGHLSEAQITDTLREVRGILLDADVALPVVNAFLQSVREKAQGQAIVSSLTPAQTLIRMVRDELVSILGGGSAEVAELSFKTQPPAVILLAGLQGAGKTTTAAKLAKWIREQHKKKNVLLVSTDVYRPAAREQLKILADALDVAFFDTQTADPIQIWKEAFAHAKKTGVEVILLDTAGRLHIDEGMMAEIKALHALAKPIETLFVADSMMGQDAANVAKQFGEAVPLTGVILTKVDGDLRGGAALSIRHITGAPIKFVGVGEATDALELFYPDRMASRILDLGDMLGFIEQAEKKLDKVKTKKSSDKIKKGQFDLQDFLDQLLQMSNMGGMEKLLSMLPGMGNMMAKAQDRLDPKLMNRQIAIIRSMTFKERRFPDLIKASQKRRIAAGSGTDVPQVNRLLKQFLDMQRMVKKMSKQGGMQKMMRAMQAMMGGGLPPGMTR